MKLILKWFTNKEIKAYAGNWYLLQSAKEKGNTNVERVIIENSLSENSYRKYKIKKGLTGFSSI